MKGNLAMNEAVTGMIPVPRSAASKRVGSFGAVDTLAAVAPAGAVGLPGPAPVSALVPVGALPPRISIARRAKSGSSPFFVIVAFVIGSCMY